MSPDRLRSVLLVDAAYSLGTGFLFLASTWDDLVQELELPAGRPSIYVQIGGALLWGFAYLLWVAARTPSLMLPVARASAIANGLTALIITVWLVRGDIEQRLGIDTLGTVLLVAAAVISAVFTALYVQAGRRPGGYGPEPPPPPSA